MWETRDFFEELEESLEIAASWISQADSLLIGAGAGMSVDSGLPDFRGEEGFWKAYPNLQECGLQFEDISDPKQFSNDPTLVWGFYGHRLNLYRNTTPHYGFDILKRWAEARNYFVFTSNVDGHFRKAGFNNDLIYECHGSIHHVQCVERCTVEIYEVSFSVTVDPQTLKLSSPLPSCPNCGGLVRPNVLMFDDGEWNWERSRIQEQKYNRWLKDQEGKNLVVLECGAGLDIPTVREACERSGSQLIRINSRDYETQPGQVSIPMKALMALQLIEKRMVSS